MRETGKQGKASFYGRKLALSESHVSEEPSTGLIKWQEKSCSEPPWEEVMLSGSAQPIRAWGMGRFLLQGDAGSAAPWTALCRWPQPYGGDFLLSRDPQGFWGIQKGTTFLMCSAIVQHIPSPS